MSGAQLGLALSVFLACAVEAVEATTIVMAVGQTRSWASAWAGVGAAAVMLAAVVAGLGSALASVSIDPLRLLIGVLLLGFGLQWLRKAILRAAGRKALHDEREVFARESSAATRLSESRRGFDRYSFAIACKGVLLEGFEVALIVVTLGSDHHHIALASASALAAIAVVAAAGFAARAPLARVPENTLKFVVGVMLSSYGIFWLAEGAGASWPGGDASLLGIMAVLLGCSSLSILALRRVRAPGELGR
ncbi:MAG TPA: hypothetical protein VK538_06480 [Solirubrobacteraceae bacterium]|nr:hypothetical protein [Solirubrobacteraceae bacterium]